MTRRQEHLMLRQLAALTLEPHPIVDLWLLPLPHCDGMEGFLTDKIRAHGVEVEVRRDQADVAFIYQSPEAFSAAQAILPDSHSCPLCEKLFDKYWPLFITPADARN